MGKVMITGATGFVGSHVVTYLDSVGYETDVLTTSEFRNQAWSRLDGVDVLVHCAWPTKTDLHSTEHLEFAEWTCNFFEECKKRGIRVINIGSSSEYGVKDVPMKEDMACEPINTYGIAKLAVTLFAKKLGYNTLRLFSPYGKGGKNFRSVWENAEKYGNPKDRRDYYPVELVGYAVERLINAPHLYGEIINVCSGESLNNYQVVRNPYLIGENPIVDEKWYKYKQSQYEPSQWVGSRDKMKKLLNL